MDFKSKTSLVIVSCRGVFQYPRQPVVTRFAQPLIRTWFYHSVIWWSSFATSSLTTMNSLPHVYHLSLVLSFVPHWKLNCMTNIAPNEFLLGVYKESAQPNIVVNHVHLCSLGFIWNMWPTYSKWFGLCFMLCFTDCTVSVCTSLSEVARKGCNAVNVSATFVSHLGDL